MMSSGTPRYTGSRLYGLVATSRRTSEKGVDTSTDARRERGTINSRAVRNPSLSA